MTQRSDTTLTFSAVNRELLHQTLVSLYVVLYGVAIQKYSYSKGLYKPALFGIEKRFRVFMIFLRLWCLAHSNELEYIGASDHTKVITNPLSSFIQENE